MLLLNYFLSFPFQHALFLHVDCVLYFLHYFISLLLVFLIDRNTFFEAGSHCLFGLNWGFLFFLFLDLSILLLVLFDEFLGVLSNEALIITLILFLLLFLGWSAWGSLASVLLKGNFINDLGDLRVTELSIF